MPVFGIRIDTKKSPTKMLLSADLQLHTQILEIIYVLAQLEDRRWHGGSIFTSLVDADVPRTLPDLATPLQIKVVRYSNPFDIVATVKGISKEMIDAVLNRTIYFKQEAERRGLENAQQTKALTMADENLKLQKQETNLKRQDVEMRRQEVALKRQEVELKKQEAVQQKIENVTKALQLMGEIQRSDDKHVDERVLRALGEILADQGATLGSGNVQVYFPPQKPKPRARRVRKPKGDL